MPTWKITAEHVGERLDQFLTSQMSDLTRSSIKNQIILGQATVNGNPASVHRFLKQDDTVVFATAVTTKPKTTKSTKKKGEEAPADLPIIPILEETADWLVINKPAGLLVHPDSKTKHGTLVDWLMAHDPKIGRIGGEPERPGIVHRLDREVSGLMVVAKTESTFENLQRQFAERKIEKTYLALVHGELSQDEGEIKFRIARSSTQARMAARPVDQKTGQAAWTHYLVKQRFVGATLVELRIFSGRTHQIRAHMHALGHPIIGDPLYTIRRTDRNLTAPRILLQSIGLSFTDPTTETRKSFTLEPDPAFKKVISTF